MQYRSLDLCVVSNTRQFHTVQRLSFETEVWKEQGPVSSCPRHDHQHQSWSCHG